MTASVVPFEGGFVVKRTPGRVHGTFEGAGAEAVRLTEQEPGANAFMVLKVVGVVVASAEGPGRTISSVRVIPGRAATYDFDTGHVAAIEEVRNDD